MEPISDETVYDTGARGSRLDGDGAEIAEARIVAATNEEQEKHMEIMTSGIAPPTTS
jgi:hypothetical protein